MASVPTSHRAASLPAPHSTHSVGDRATPSISPDELLIKVTATAINPVDWKIRDYNIFVSSYPAVIGSDAAGTVALVGSNFTSQFKPGERVFFQGIIGTNDCSTFQQYTKMPAALVGKTPSKITDNEAAGISLTTVAAVTGLYDKTGQGLTPPWDKGGSEVGAGKAAIVLGGSSSVGQSAIQLARLTGFERIITNSSTAHKEYLESLGATTVLDRSKATAKDFKEAAGNLQVGFVLDGVSTKDTQILGVQILQGLSGGNVVVVMSPNEEAIKLGEEPGQKPVKIKHVVGLGSSPALRYLSEPLFKALGGENGWLASGKYIPNRPEVVPGGLEALEEALEKNKKGVSGIKVVIRPNDG
jgi:NADPH:quinone reductase-like Zn-dependent oxidoreductase